MEGVLGFIPGLFRTLMSLDKLGLLSRRIVLQGLALPHRVLELLLDFIDPGLEPLTGGLLLDSLPLGFDQGRFQGLDLGRRLCSHHGILFIAYHFPLFADGVDLDEFVEPASPPPAE